MATLSAKTSLSSGAIVTTSSDLEREIIRLTEGSPHYFRLIIMKMANANLQNAKALCKFISSETSERNLKLSSRLTKIKILCLFSRHLHYKQFQIVTKDDIRNYLDSSRKPEAQDPTRKWIGTYNTRQMVICKFFRWLCNYHTEPDSNKWITPPCIQGIRQLPRKEKSPYKPSDMWSPMKNMLYF